MQLDMLDRLCLDCSSSGRAVHTSVCSPGTGESGARARLASRTAVRCDFLSQCARRRND